MTNPSILTKLQLDPRPWVLPLSLLAVWWSLTTFGWVDTRLIVAPQAVWSAGAKAVTEPLFWQGLVYSIGRDLGGFALGALGGVALGALLGASRLADRLIGPSFHALRQISLFAWLPLLSTWLGYGEPAKLVFIALSVLYPVALGTLDGVRGIGLPHAEVARVFAFTRRQWLFRLILPAAAPQIATGLTLGLIYAWVATIGSEFLLANWGNGLGNIIIKGRAAFNVELILVGMLAIGLVGSLLSAVAARLEAHALRWQPRQA